MAVPPNPSESLTKLLRLKREEQPDASFWDTFEHELAARRLQALTEGDADASRRAWFGSWQMLLGSVLTSAVAVALVFTILPQLSSLPASGPELDDPAVAQTTLPAPQRVAAPAAVYFASAPAAPVPAPASAAASRALSVDAAFVDDALDSQSRLSSPTFRTVRYTPRLSWAAAPQSRYIQDAFSGAAQSVGPTITPARF